VRREKLIYDAPFSICDLGGARTLDPMIKSHLLYQLSYQVEAILFSFPVSDLGGARTLDPMIKSHLLYQLSYQVEKHRDVYFLIAGAKICVRFFSANIFLLFLHSRE
jgi:hypothetical protein